MVGDGLDEVAEVVGGVEAVEFGGGEEAVEMPGVLGGFFGAGKQIVFAAQGNGADLILDQVVVDLYAAIVEVAFEVFEALERVGNGFAKAALGQGFGVLGLLLQPGFGGGEQGLGPALAQLVAQDVGFFEALCPGHGFPGPGFDVVEQANEAQGGFDLTRLVAALGLEEFTAQVGKAGQQGDGWLLIEGFIDRIAIGLEFALKARQGFARVFASPAGVVVKKNQAVERVVVDPVVAAVRLARRGRFGLFARAFVQGPDQV